MTRITQNGHLHNFYIKCFFFAFINFSLVFATTVKPLLNPYKLNGTRRILRGNDVVDTLPFMVYLRPATAEMQQKDANWLCGGVIIHEQYILTSAACIEDAKRFYVVSGTHRWIPPGTGDECISNGAKRATWKIVPKNYVYDGDDLNNIRWMINDIAVVRVEDNFNFEKRIRGCDFIPQKISYNNQSENLESSGTVGTIAGWGSMDRFGGEFGRTTVNSPNLQEADVILISKKNCKKHWPDRYHYIIDESMICAKDGADLDESQICLEQDGNCKELVYSTEDETYRTRRFIKDPNKLEVHTAAHIKSSRRTVKRTSGGFCENDHGGPLVVGHGPTAVVIGIISACLTANVTQKCYGPFLYTSVWKNQHLINCAIDKTAACSKYLRSRNNQMDETQFDWTHHQEGFSNINQERDSANSRLYNENTEAPRAYKTRTSSKKYYKG